jgi:cytochrome P450
VKVGPYTVPRGYNIQANFDAIMKGEQDWNNRHTFDPSRFLDVSGRIQKNDHLIPFSIGKRTCPGESLAKVELYLFFVGILQKFKFSAEDASNPPPVTYTSGVTSAPKPFTVKVTKVDNVLSQ